MKKTALLTVLMLILSVIQLFGQFPSHVTLIKSKPNDVVSVKGNLEQGKMMNDLSWASSSSVACFPATQNSKFTGNHVLYATKLPPRAKMYITLIPDDRNANFSLYAYSMGATDFQSIVPKLSSCVSCEADHKWDRPRKGKTQDHTRQVYLNAITNPYNVIIGVVGAEGLKSGAFTLEIKMEGGEQAIGNKQEKVVVKTFTSEKNKLMTLKGDLNEGVKIYDLSWASKSSVACFPATQNSKFTGNHVVYSTQIPTYSEMTITVIPKNTSANFSLYAYTIGVNNNSIVPELHSCVSCEADHKWDRPRRGKTQDHTRSVKLMAVNRPYKVIIGVTGADGLSDGEFTLRVAVKSR